MQGPASLGPVDARARDGRGGARNMRAVVTTSRKLGHIGGIRAQRSGLRRHAVPESATGGMWMFPP
jgi:hypothetical protein